MMSSPLHCLLISVCPVGGVIVASFTRELSWGAHPFTLDKENKKRVCGCVHEHIFHMLSPHRCICRDRTVQIEQSFTAWTTERLASKHYNWNFSVPLHNLHTSWCASSAPSGRLISIRTASTSWRWMKTLISSIRQWWWLELFQSTLQVTETSHVRPNMQS